MKPLTGLVLLSVCVRTQLMIHFCSVLVEPIIAVGLFRMHCSLNSLHLNTKMCLIHLEGHLKKGGVMRDESSQNCEESVFVFDEITKGVKIPLNFYCVFAVCTQFSQFECISVKRLAGKKNKK